MPLFRRLLWLLCCVFASAPLFAQASFTTVVVFGDSLSDTGNIAHVTQSQFLVRFPADNTLLGFDYTDGRFTDGSDTQPAAVSYFGVWAEQLAASFASKPAVKDALDGGTNFAYGGATTQDGTATLSETFDGIPVSITIHNMGQQVTDYLSGSPAPVPNAHTLYILWGGANDLYADDSAAGVTAAVQREVALVQRLVTAGGTYFMVPNLPPLGGVPDYASGSSAAALNAAAASFAAQLAQALGALKISAAAQGQTVTIYQPDIFTLFGTVAANPRALGFGNITMAAQNVSDDPDTYLIWDGLHPTTVGHHYVAAAAANLLTPLVASSTALTTPAAVLAGQSIVLSAAVTSTASKTTPTGGVTFFQGTSAIGSAPLSASGTASLSFPGAAVSGSPYSFTAVYDGDTTYSQSQASAASVTVLAAAVGTSTSVMSSNLNANSGAAVTFTATVTPSVTSYGPATGTVTFLDGTITLGMGTLSNGMASYTTSVLAGGPHSITASYAASGVFAGSTSPAINQVVALPAFTASASPNPLTVTSGTAGATTITATGTGGYAGTLTLACGTLPAHLACTFSSGTLTAQQHLRHGHVYVDHRHQRLRRAGASAASGSAAKTAGVCRHRLLPGAWRAAADRHGPAQGQPRFGAGAPAACLLHGSAGYDRLRKLQQRGPRHV